MKRVFFMLLMAHGQHVVPVRVRVDTSRLRKQIDMKREEDAWLRTNVPLVAARFQQLRAEQRAMRWWLKRTIGNSFRL